MSVCVYVSMHVSAFSLSLYKYGSMQVIACSCTWQLPLIIDILCTPIANNLITLTYVH